MEEEDSLDLSTLTNEQLCLLVTHLVDGRNALSLVVQGHIAALADVADIPPDAAKAAVTLAACWNDLLDVSDTTIRRIQAGAIGEVN